VTKISKKTLTIEVGFDAIPSCSCGVARDLDHRSASSLGQDTCAGCSLASGSSGGQAKKKFDILCSTSKLFKENDLVDVDFSTFGTALSLLVKIGIPLGFGIIAWVLVAPHSEALATGLSIAALFGLAAAIAALMRLMGLEWGVRIRARDIESGISAKYGI
jgi:hypothetical protein